MPPPNESPDTGSVDIRKELERFVIENDDLLAIESRIGRFNVFDALGIARAEIRHSNFFVFILDPSESHGQGQLFLKAILMDLLKDAPEELRPLSPIQLDGTVLGGVETQREWNNIDLLITSKEPPFAVVIENKVDAHEHSGQLDRYTKVVRARYPDLKVLHVYLTPEGDEPTQATEASWLPYTYRDIHRVLSRVRKTYQNAIGDEVLVFLDHYLNLLGTRFMEDQELDSLCRSIYKNHRHALDVIWERIGSPNSAALREVTEVLEQDTRWHILYQSSSYVEFLPKTWLNWLILDSDDYYPFFVHLRLRETNLGYTFFVGPMPNQANRKEIITHLRKNVQTIGLKPSKAYQISQKWNRITAIDRFLQWDESEPPESEAFRAAVKKILDELYPKLEKLAAITKPLYAGNVPAANPNKTKK